MKEDNNVLKKETITYLRDNDLNLSSALYFTWKDYMFITEHKLKQIIINKDKIRNLVKCEEVLTKKDIVNRLRDLWFIHKMHYHKSDVNEEAIQKVLAENEKI